MVTFYSFNHRFKRSMLEITPSIFFDLDWNQVDPLQKVKYLADVPFKIAAGKKKYDIIRVYENIGVFYSQKVIDVLEEFVDMSDKCYPIEIESVEEKYYVIYNLPSFSLLNGNVNVFIDEPCFFDFPSQESIPIFGIENTLFVIISEDVKNALLKHKVSNIELIECFGCTLDEYEGIKRMKFQPEVHVFRDK